MTDALKLQLEELFNKILAFVMSILKVEFPELDKIING